MTTTPQGQVPEALYATAMEFAAEKASVAYVQRKTGCSLTEAEQMLERMVREGIIETYSGRNTAQVAALTAPVAPSIDLRNFKQFYDVSEFTVAMSFMSCRAAQQFKREISAALSQPAPGVESNTAYDQHRRIEYLIGKESELLKALEIIALGEAPNPVIDAGDELVALGYWDADALAALRASHGQAPAGVANTKTHDLLSTAVGLLMGYREGAARQPYKPGSAIAKVVDEVVDHLKDWPYPEPTPTAQAARASYTAGSIECEMLANRILRIAKAANIETPALTSANVLYLGSAILGAAAMALEAIQAPQDDGFNPTPGAIYQSQGHGTVTFKTMDFERGEPIFHFDTARGIRYMKREQMLRDIKRAPQADSGVQEDAARLDHLQQTGSTIDILPGVEGFYPMRFRIGGMNNAISDDVREAIDKAIANRAARATGAKP